MAADLCSVLKMTDAACEIVRPYQAEIAYIIKSAQGDPIVIYVVEDEEDSSRHEVWTMPVHHALAFEKEYGEPQMEEILTTQKLRRGSVFIVVEVGNTRECNHVVFSEVSVMPMAKGGDA